MLCCYKILYFLINAFYSSDTLSVLWWGAGGGMTGAWELRYFPDRFNLDCVVSTALPSGFFMFFVGRLHLLPCLELPFFFFFFSMGKLLSRAIFFHLHWCFFIIISLLEVSLILFLFSFFSSFFYFVFHFCFVILWLYLSMYSVSDFRAEISNDQQEFCF